MTDPLPTDPTADEYDRRAAELEALIAAQMHRVRAALAAYQAEYRTLAQLEKTLRYLPVEFKGGPE